MTILAKWFISKSRSPTHMPEAGEKAVLQNPTPSPAEVLDAAAAGVSHLQPHSTSNEQKRTHSQSYPPNVLIVDIEMFQLRKDFLHH